MSHGSPRPWVNVGVRLSWLMLAAEAAKQTLAIVAIIVDMLVELAVEACWMSNEMKHHLRCAAAGLGPRATSCSHPQYHDRIHKEKRPHLCIQFKNNLENDHLLQIGVLVYSNGG